MTPSQITDSIIAEIAEPYGFTVADMKGPSATRRLAHVRAEAYAAVRLRRRLSLEQTGRVFGNRDHTTVLTGIQKYEARMAWGDFLRWAGNVEQPDLFARLAA